MSIILKFKKSELTKVQRYILGTIIAIILLIASNPSKNDYYYNALSRYDDYRVINTTTEHNFYIGTIFDTSYGGHEVITLGILGTFVSNEDVKRFMYGTP